MYTAFVTDVFSRRNVGWALSDSMRTEALPLQALNQAIASAEETTGLIHHSDHGSQYVSVVYNERLAQHGIAASTGTVGDSYDNADVLGPVIRMVNETCCFLSTHDRLVESLQRQCFSPH